MTVFFEHSDGRIQNISEEGIDDLSSSKLEASVYEIELVLINVWVPEVSPKRLETILLTMIRMFVVQIDVAQDHIFQTPIFFVALIPAPGGSWPFHFRNP